MNEGERILLQVVERIAQHSETTADGKVTTFYYPMPDGSVRFSQYTPLLHASGTLTGEEAEECRRKQACHGPKRGAASS